MHRGRPSALQRRALVALRALVAATRVPPEAPPEVLRDALVTTLLDALLEALCRARDTPPWSLGYALPEGTEIVRYRTIVEGFRRGLPEGELLPEHLGEVHEALRAYALVVQGRGYALVRDATVRGAGAHYTPAAVARAVVAEALRPLQDRALETLRVLDPAVGGGVFLLEAGRWLRARSPALDARSLEGCLHGVDRDPLAVAVTRASLALAFATPGARATAFVSSVVQGDALVDARAPEALRDSLGAPVVDWPRTFPEVFSRAPAGFDAVLGNPPWVAYAGRASQPLGKPLRRWYTHRSPAFRGYRTLHGLFVHQSAELLRPGGRLGLVLPTSIADLAGYRFTRDAHDALCRVDDPLPDLGDGRFAGVFQPAMALLSTRRENSDVGFCGQVWSLVRNDLDAPSAALLARLLGGERLPAALFGERGFQSSPGDRARLHRWGSRQGLAALREGRDVREFQRLGPRWGIDPEGLGPRWRSDSAWAAVRALVRQTARFPVCAASDGGAFRNSLLAVFTTEAVPWTAALAYLNSTPARWFHYHRWRDARQGMPQVKVQHLRALPAPAAEVVPALAALGERLAARNDGVAPAERHALDALAAAALDLTGSERALVTRWAETS